MQHTLGSIQRRGRLLIAGAAVLMAVGVGMSLALTRSAAAACGGYGQPPCPPPPCPLGVTPNVIRRGNLVLVKGSYGSFCTPRAADTAGVAAVPKAKLHSAAFAKKNVYAKLNRAGKFSANVKIGSMVKPGKYKIASSFQSTKVATTTLTVKK